MSDGHGTRCRCGECRVVTSEAERLAMCEGSLAEAGELIATLTERAEKAEADLALTDASWVDIITMLRERAERAEAQVVAVRALCDEDELPWDHDNVEYNQGVRCMASSVLQALKETKK